MIRKVAPPIKRPAATERLDGALSWLGWLEPELSVTPIALTPR
jgi:hypothetical protein